MAESHKAGRIVTIGVVLSLTASAFFFWVWYERYLRFDFNELGRYYDPEAQIVYTDAGVVWSVPAFGFLLLALIRLTIAVRRRMKARVSGE